MVRSSWSWRDGSRLRTFTALPEDPTSVPRTGSRLSNACNSSSRNQEHTHSLIHTNTNEIFLKNCWGPRNGCTVKSTALIKDPNMVLSTHISRSQLLLLQLQLRETQTLLGSTGICTHVCVHTHTHRTDTLTPRQTHTCLHV